MVLCIIALPLFAALSLFSAKYRPYARASFDCVFRRLTLRPCNTGFEEQIKSDIVAALLPRFAPGAKFVNKHYDALSWAFVLLTLVSLLLTVVGVYNYVSYGTCDPADPNAFCPLRAVFGSNQATNINELVAPNSSLGMRAGNASAPVTVVEFGDYTCPYTKSAEVGLLQLLQARGGGVNFVYKPFPLPTHNNSRQAALAGYCASNPTPTMMAAKDKSLPTTPPYWAYRAALFSNQADVSANGTDALLRLAAQVNQSGSADLDLAAFGNCLNNSETLYGAYLNASMAEGNASRLYATPTFFVNGKPLVGPIPYEQLSYSVDHAQK